MPVCRRSTSHQRATGLRRPARRLALLLVSGLSIAAPMPAVSVAKETPTARASIRDPYADYIAEAARRFQLPSAWIRAVLRSESSGDFGAVSRKGAMGLMQIMPKTWADLRIRYHLGHDPHDAHDNIIAGAAYMRELLDRFGMPGWIAAYNAGPSRFEASLKGRPLPTETRAYVVTVVQAMGGRGIPLLVKTRAADRSPSKGASLFIAPSGRNSGADSMSIERWPSVLSTVGFAPDVSAIEAQSSGLFVTRTRQEIAQ